MNTDVLTHCVRQYVLVLLGERGVDAFEQWLAQPDSLWASHGADLCAELTKAGIDVSEFRRSVRQHPFTLFREIFPTDDLPDTPMDWTPVPSTHATRCATIAMIFLASLAGMEIVSYGSENGGAPFVNLVTLPGHGAMPEKSRGPMRGHTDAASFPFRGTQDPKDSRIAPSPDIVFLAGLRNPDKVPTIVMPLGSILEGIGADEVQVLKEPRLVLNSQRSFQKGTEKILGAEHLLDGGSVLFDGEEGTWVRYTHSQSTVHDPEDLEAVSAKAAFEGACAKVMTRISLEPGDLLLVNNRKALHGRSPVGAATGGHSRWLIRGYALDCSKLSEESRYGAPPYQLYP